MPKNPIQSGKGQKRSSMKTIAINSIKGGKEKSSLTAFLTNILANARFRCLSIYADARNRVKTTTLTVKDIPIEDIQVKMNIRKDYSDIFELAESIKQYGLLQPITVYAEKDAYTVKSGHRRLMAYKRLHKEEPEKFHSIRSIISDAHNAEIVQLIENVQRVDLSQHDLFTALNKLREQGMALKQIAEAIGKTEGYVKSLFVGVNELNRDKDLQNLIGDAGITIRDIAETNSVKDKKKRIELLEERKEGKVSREQMRGKVREITAPKPKKENPDARAEKGKLPKAYLSIKAFPDLNKIVIYQVKSRNKEQLMALEQELRSFFSAYKEKYSIEKTAPKKEKP
jgi:ParB family transcriptional regulator, chromosome partitioning protein